LRQNKTRVSERNLKKKKKCPTNGPTTRTVVTHEELQQGKIADVLSRRSEGGRGKWKKSRNQYGCVGQLKLGMRNRPIRRENDRLPKSREVNRIFTPLFTAPESLGRNVYRNQTLFPGPGLWTKRKKVMDTAEKSCLVAPSTLRVTKWDLMI